MRLQALICLPQATFPGDITEERKSSAANFLVPYHIVFTTNYDLLLYWVAMHAEIHLHIENCFHSDQAFSDAPYLVFSQRLGDTRGLLYLHGALHLYLNNLNDGQLRKHSWRSARSIAGWNVLRSECACQ
jgi:hypothetical protein